MQLACIQCPTETLPPYRVAGHWRCKCKAMQMLRFVYSKAERAGTNKVQRDGHAHHPAVACVHLKTRKNTAYIATLPPPPAAAPIAQPLYAAQGFRASQSLAALALTRPQPYWLSLPLGPRSSADCCSAALISALLQRG